MKHEQNITSIIKSMENNYYTVKLEVKRSNVCENSLIYLTTGIFQNTTQLKNLQMTETETFQESTTEVKFIFPL